MLNRTDISTFSLDILRRDKRQEFSRDFTEGDAFQQLCFDLLTHDFKNKGIRLTLYPTKGPDGGVDISGEDSNHNKIIIECKKNNTIEDAQKALNDLKSTLLKSLGKPEASESRYSSWFNPQFQQYIYCVSCTFPTDHKRENFKKKIKDMLEGLSDIEGLKHLQQVAEKVELYSWDDLKPILENTPFLYHKWIEANFIEGVENVSKPINPKEPRYKDYLYTEKLKYFSRKQYRAENPEAGDLVTEADIFDNLLHQERYNGCIIYGEGGIGKTRMMMELGFTAEKQGWIVYKITKDIESLGNLRNLLYPGSKHLLVFDYIEENPLFEPNIVEQLYDIHPETCIKVIGNCRKTYTYLPELLDTEEFLKVDLSLKNSQREQDYNNYVIANILGDLQRFFKVEKSFYELRPSFAVFLRFLNEKYKEKEEVDFREVDSFRKWLRRRLCLTFGVKKYKELSRQKERFYLFYILPTTGSLTDNLCSTHHDSILSLKKDGWIEDDENLLGKDEYKNELRVIHDTIAEEILILRLDDQKESLKTEIKKIFDFAIANNSFESCFRLFERISHWFVNEEFHTREEINRHPLLFYELFSQYIDQCQQACEPLRDLLTKTSLMGEASIVTLMVEKLDFFKETIQSQAFGLRLALKMKYFSKNDSSANIKDKVKILLDMWLAANHDLLKYRYISVRVIADFLKLFGLDDYFGPKGKPVIYAKEWLEGFHTTIDASFLIKSWLDAGGEKEIIKEYITPWLKKFPLQMETSFVIKSWLLAEGEKSLVKQYIEKWLDKFPAEMETHFVIKVWLDKGGEKEIVNNYMTPWLKKFPLEMGTSFVINSWLNTGGEKEIVKDYITPWLKKFPEEKETEFIIFSWLKAGGNLETIKKYIKPWLTKFPLEKEETSFIIKAWLNAGGEPEEVAPFVIQWLKKYHGSFDATYVIKAWINRTNDTDFIKTYALQWLQAFKDHPDADFVIKRFCKYIDIDISDDILDAAVHWCKKYENDSEALFALSYLTQYHIKNEKIANQWLMDNLANWIDRQILNQDDIKNLETIMYYIRENQEFCYSEKGNELNIKWFLSEHSFQPITLQERFHFLQQWYYFKRYSWLLTRERLDIAANVDKVKKFLNWVNGWLPENKELIKRNIEKLMNAFPQYNHLWEMVQLD